MTKKHPTKRRVEIECGFCGEPTLAGIGICPKCQQIYTAGKKAIAARASDELQYYCMGMYEVSLTGVSNRSSSTSLLGLIQILTGKPVETFSSRKSLRNGGRWLSGENVRPPYADVLLTTEQADFVKRFIEDFHKHMQNETLWARRKGESWVTRLAKGEISTTDLTAHERLMKAGVK